MKYTIAEILHYAADKCLASERYEYWVNGGKKEKYSCCAVEEAYIKLHGLYDCDYFSSDVARIQEGLKNMGCPVSSTTALCDAGTFIKENQQTRYTWLKFAAMMAEEQGV